MARPIGIYEKATPKHFSWPERLAFAKELGFDFVEMSVDESDERLARLSWSKEQRLELVKAFMKAASAFRPYALAAIAATRWAPMIQSWKLSHWKL